jgi:mannonate dehydratase
MMRQGWRWFGPSDPVTLDHARQAGATDIVSALHQAPPGVAWTREQVEERRALIEDRSDGRTPLRWSVVESIPVADEIKREGRGARAAIDAWIASLEAVAAVGPRIVCYNFMPVLDWTRTDLDWPLPTGATALRFDQRRFAAFDLHVLERPGAGADYTDSQRAEARKVADGFSDDDVTTLVRTVLAGLPGGTTRGLSLDEFRDSLDAYASMDAARLRANLIGFLDIVAPIAESLGVRLTIHPDDPPRPLFGLPRVASTRADFEALFSAVPTPANGLCFCTGSLGVRADNDLVAMAAQFAGRIYFTHLRATRRDEDQLSFQEADHLDGDVDMPAILAVLMAENRHRSEDGRIVVRPDHGHRMLADLDADGIAHPGYTAAGRMKGLGELRGIMRVLDRLPDEALAAIR